MNARRQKAPTPLAGCLPLEPARKLLESRREHALLREESRNNTSGRRLLFSVCFPIFQVSHFSDDSGAGKVGRLVQLERSCRPVIMSSFTKGWILRRRSFLKKVIMFVTHFRRRGPRLGGSCRSQSATSLGIRGGSTDVVNVRCSLFIHGGRKIIFPKLWPHLHPICFHTT